MHFSRVALAQDHMEGKRGTIGRVLRAIHRILEKKVS